MENFNNDLLVDDNFSFFMPADIVKSEKSKSEEPEMRIAGFASTSKQDREDDIIIQKGLDISDFLEYGFLNYDHDSTKIVGYPDKEKTKLTPNGFWVEGILLPGVELAKSIWNTAVALKKSNSDRRLGFSVEGKTLKRDVLGRIVKAKVYHVAVTGTPVNASCTWDALCKSFSMDSCKALSTQSTGSVLIPESLESAFKTLSYTIGDDSEATLHLNQLKQILAKKQNLTKSELILYFQLTKGLSFTDSESLVQKIINL